jgi:hypothetical protein
MASTRPQRVRFAGTNPMKASRLGFFPPVHDAAALRLDPQLARPLQRRGAGDEGDARAAGRAGDGLPGALGGRARHSGTSRLAVPVGAGQGRVGRGDRPGRPRSPGHAHAHRVQPRRTLTRPARVGMFRAQEEARKMCMLSPELQTGGARRAVAMVRTVAARTSQQRPRLEPLARGAPPELDDLGQCRPVGGRTAGYAGLRGTRPPLGTSAGCWRPPPG